MEMFREQGKPFTEEQVQQFIKAADKNNDGKIQKKELYNLYKNMGKEASAK